MTYIHKLANRLALLKGALLLVVLAVGCSDDQDITAPIDAAAFAPTFDTTTDPGVTLVGAGNIARCDGTNDQATATLLDNIAGTVFTVGDNTHASGSLSDFQNCYGPSWGRHRTRTRPSAGDNDYKSSGAAGYYSYFGASAGQTGRGYYSYDAGDWHVVVLNSSIEMSAGSPQEQWLRTDLAASTRQCTIAYWHYPRFSSYGTAVRAEVKPLWDALHAAGADVVVNGHYRIYERFAPQDPDGAADATYGIRQFTVGTGGSGADKIGTVRPNSEVRRAGIYGVLKLTLMSGSYSWTFVPVAGTSFSESGTGTCHASPNGGSTADVVTMVTTTPATASIVTGTTTQLNAAATNSAGTPVSTAVISWSSTSSSIASVSATGLVTGVATGTTSIIASSGGKSDTAAVTVTAPAPAGFFAIGQRVTAAGNPNIRNGPSASSTLLGQQPTGSLGTVVGGPIVDSNGDGLTRWQVNFDSGVDGWAAQDYLAAVPSTPTAATVNSVVVTPSSVNVAAGASVILTAVARDAAGATVPGAAMSWNSLDTLRAKVTAAGIVTGVAVGTAMVIATSDGKSDTATVAVTTVPVASVTVTPATASINTLATVQILATPRDATGTPLTGRSVTWSSSNALVATVSASGLVTGVLPGSVTISATSEGRTGNASVTVTLLPGGGGGTPTIRPGYYVSPGGTSSANGSYSQPFSLATALSGGGGRVQPGDTIWVRGGTYRGAFTSTVAGVAGRPVVVRAYPGERVVIDHSGTSLSTLQVRGAWSVFWGIEIMNSNGIRTTSSTASEQRANGLVNNASNTKYINMVVHDAGVGFYNYTNLTNVEVYGSIFYNNGWQGPDRGHGHALYVKSDAGPIVLRDNVMFNQYGWGVHLYTNAGSGKLNNIRVEGNASFNNGTQSNNSTSENILLGGADYSTGSVITDNFTWHSPGVNARNVRVGYGTLRNGTVVVRNNVVAGGSPALDVGYWTQATISQNTVVGAASLIRQNDPSVAGHIWSGNTHRRDPSSSSWYYNGSSRTFSAWQSATGIAGSDQAMNGTPATQVFVRPNAYESGRATVVVYNWARQGSVNVNLSGVLNVGDAYEVRNVQDYFGAPVTSGTFGGSINIPMTGVVPPAPIGVASSRSPRTGPDFDVFVVVKR